MKLVVHPHIGGSWIYGKKVLEVNYLLFSHILPSFLFTFFFLLLSFSSSFFLFLNNRLTRAHQVGC